MVEILKLIPSAAWISLSSVILASACTLLGVWLTNKANIQHLKVQLENEKRIHDEDLRRNQIEELYVSSNKYLNSVFTYFLPYKMTMTGELTFNQALDYTVEQGNKNDIEPHRVTMLIKMYFSELQPAFEEIMLLRNNLNKIIQAFKYQYKSGDTDGSEFLTLFQPKFEELAKLIENFDLHIVNLNNYSSDKQKKSKD